MDGQRSPHISLQSGATQAESDGEQYYSGEDDSIGGDANPNSNGDGPRKRPRRPMSVS